ncbi:YbaB/EbfC family nucleoid-associated protein [Cyanobacterium sp. Dongsha4]|uniref:YbaB/EbfC family nucleoid-associated protein n=1 Tax=Cyanobacterium sp. DS4 TaxID=2878255 RepID=UPI002E8042CA|nr:YbaB/EbfC family nucleoid-associated protein [Cyanobacterium sp. Dongsha4]WVL01209.1 YbaB/EbfC family nucleoid-associated protein [Cyanobacterium sp. Dongsha4]
MAEKKGFGLGLGKMKELANAFQKAQQIQEDAKKLQEELETMQIEGQCENGLVVVTMSGNQEPLKVEIKPEAMGEGAEKLSEMVTEAVRNAYQISTTTMREKMEALTGNLGLPGM